MPNEQASHPTLVSVEVKKVPKGAAEKVRSALDFSSTTEIQKRQAITMCLGTGDTWVRHPSEHMFCQSRRFGDSA